MIPNKEFTLIRKTFSEEFTLGELLLDGTLFGYTCEDTDRHLESGGTKIPGDTAIPLGTYELSISLSNRFKKVMPILFDVPNFSGVRIHGGNTHEDTEGCPLLGAVATSNGVTRCAGVVLKLISLIDETERFGGHCYITIKREEESGDK